MSDKALFVLRRVSDISEVNALEGAFRVQIPPKELRSLGLKSGDFCRLTSEDGNKVGLAIAWQSTDLKDSGKRIVKISDCLKDTYRFSLEDRVTITKTTEQLQAADIVTVSLVAGVSDMQTGYEEDELKFWVSYFLAKLDAIVPIATFKTEVQRSPSDIKRLRFLVESVATNAGTGNQQHKLWPSRFDHKTKVIINNELKQEKPDVAPQSCPEITFAGIGGLQTQINKMNQKIQILNDDARRLRAPPAVRKRGCGILLYGPSGTGKSLLLDKLTDAGWSSVHRLDSNVLPTNVSQSQAMTRDIFAKAQKSQPSAILIDGLEEIAGRPDAQNSSYTGVASSLVAEMEKCRGSKVLVVATTSSLMKVDPRLRKKTVFCEEIDIPVPDSTSRTEILKVLQQKDKHAYDQISETIGIRTHGFVGSDLEALFTTAWDYADALLAKSQDKQLNRLKDATDATDANSITEAGIVASSSEDQNINNPQEISTLQDNTPQDDSNMTSQLQQIHLTLEHFEFALRTVQPTAMNEIFLETPIVRWTDIGGSESIRETLDNVCLRPFQHPEIIKSLNLPVTRGILLYGPPGCSKTLCAKAVATECGFNFLAVKGPELISMYVGESERNVREIFHKARAASPSIIFFDEIDAIASSRFAGEHTPGLNIVSTLLNEMDGIETLKDVLVLAATNRPDALDPALLRPGRFDAKVYVGLPNLEARRQILDISCRKRPLGADVVLETLAGELEGYTGAEVVQVCTEAADVVAGEWVKKKTHNLLEDGERIEICWRHFEVAMKKVVRGVTPGMVAKFMDWKGGSRGF